MKQQFNKFYLTAGILPEDDSLILEDFGTFDTQCLNLVIKPVTKTSSFVQLNERITHLQI